MLLANKTALITGSSRGIGLGVAQAFLEQGARIVTNSEQPLPEVPEFLNEGNARYLQADLLRDGEPQRLVNEAWNLLGGIDILVNNVGTFREPPLLEIQKSHFDFIFNLNVWAPLATTIEFVRRAGSQGGRILFTTSLNATRSEPNHVLYDPSKGAINALTRQLAIELAPLNFTVLALAPGLIETPLTDYGLRSDPAARQAIIEQIPMRRIGTVEEIAPWYVFLASDLARYATGTIIPLDGGLDAQQMPSRPIGEGEKRATQR
jgi:NAD(P)-dependent dehydrogenase (short-subunit alcohol dehydrogenase family)